MKEENWEKEFDKKIVTDDREDGFIVYIEGYDNTDFDCDRIKSFIQQLLDKERNQCETAREEIARIEGIQAERACIVGMVEGMITFCQTKPDLDHATYALTDLLSKIKE